MPDTAVYKPSRAVRVVTSTALFDGHDAAINIMRRILQDTGVEVIHLGHNRSATEIVDAAIQEDADAIAVSSYQGGHVEFFAFMVDLLRERGAGHIQIFGGGGGVIVPEEIEAIQSYGKDGPEPAAGVTRIFSPEDGQQLGLQGMINAVVEAIDRPREPEQAMAHASELSPKKPLYVARYISAIEDAHAKSNGALKDLATALPRRVSPPAPVLGITGTGGAGKSSLVDELLLRFLADFTEQRVAVISVDPSRRRTGGALLGDRIRMNCLDNPRVYMRSLATRQTDSAVSASLTETIAVMQSAGFDLILVETAGIGQGDAAIVPFVDVALYVMTAEFGAPTQLEKIDMIDQADLIAINKFERPGSADAMRYVAKQYQRNHRLFDAPLDEMPVYGTIASQFNDDGVTALYHGVLEALNTKCGAFFHSETHRPASRVSSRPSEIVPGDHVRYLAEIAQTVREYRKWAEGQAQLARNHAHLKAAAALTQDDAARQALEREAEAAYAQLDHRCRALLEAWPDTAESYRQPEAVYTVRGKEIRTPAFRESLAGAQLPRIGLPRLSDAGDLLRWLLMENLPGFFPFTAGVFPFRRTDEDVARMFAGEGDPDRTNRRFHYLSKGSEAKRLSTAFDSVTLYGWDPEERPDIYGKVGTSGVSICTLDDMKRLYAGFDLCAPNTSVSMTINGPAPTILAFFLNTAIDQQLEKFASEQGRPPTDDEAAELRLNALRLVRGTVQADILKEDQGQNTCIFAIDFALRMMGDIQQYFIEHEIRNFYSVSISGYHIAEAGANPISQVAFTLANGFTFVEYYLARGMDIDKFAPSLSFFFSHGMDPEYAVINRVARRIWSVAMRERYGADERSQKLKAHIQTSGRSLHAQEMAFNDIRTTLQALTALYDNCNSLHTNAYDEAVTTPSQESVRRAQAIQLIINKEYGIFGTENATQGSFIIEELTDLVEEAILCEFERISERGGVLGAMEKGYQRGKIQDESMYYEWKKNSGSLPIIGVNTFRSPEDAEPVTQELELARGTEGEKQGQLERLRAFQAANRDAAPAALARLQEAAITGGNIFAELMDATRVCSLGQITQALFAVGGKYRRNT